MKVSELTDEKLDYWVAKAEKMYEGYVAYRAQSDSSVTIKSLEEWMTYVDYSPSTDWSQGGPIIEREKICIKPRIGTVAWYAEIAMEIKQDYVFETGESPLVAAMRCYVASKFGEEVPDESVS